MHNGVLDIEMTVEVLKKCADLVVPVLDNLGHYADWIGKQPFKYIVPTDRLDES